MTFNYHSQIEAYEAEKVNLSEAVRSDLYAKREANRSRLRENLPKRFRIKEFIPQGSMAIRTTVQQEDGDYDIDDGVVFFADDLVDWLLRLIPLFASDVREIVRDALKDDKFNRQPEIIGNCVRVFYAQGYHVDVPAFRVMDPDSESERQELAGKDGWRSSDPTEINRWFESRVQRLNDIQEDAGSQFRRMVRLLKRFARSRGKQWNMPNGLKLTMLVDECFERSYKRDDKAFYFLLLNLCERLQKSKSVCNRAQKNATQDSLTKSEEDANMVELHQHVEEALNQLKILWDDKCTLSQARAAWDWIFQTNGFFHDFDQRNQVACLSTAT